MGDGVLVWPLAVAPTRVRRDAARHLQVGGGTPMRVHEFQTELWLPLPPEKLFPFFADAANLDAITPPCLHFHIVTPPPIAMREGALIDYRLRVHGIPLRWRTRINEWQPPHRFVDEQLR